MPSQTNSMTEEKTNEQQGESPEAARRRKLEKITSLGHDPWGHRFDDRTLIGDIRARDGEVKYVLEDGTEPVSYTHLTLPTTPYV